MSSPPAPAASAPASPALMPSAAAILAVAAFAIVTTEFLMVGLLPALARDMGVSVSAAGQLVTLFAVVVTLSGPLLTAWMSHLERKRLFVAILLLFAVSNALAAVSANLGVLAIARIVPALALPVFWGTASETAARIAGPARAGRAVSTVYLGISAAMLFGIPLGTLSAGVIGWQGAFWALAALCLMVALLLQGFMPRTEATARVDLRQQAKIFHEPRFVANVALSVTVFTAMFTGYTYLAEMLERLAHIEPAQVGWWLMGFGAIGLVGNGLGGRWVQKSALAATAGFCLVLAAGMAATVYLAPVSIVGLAVALALWGISNTALYPICQIRVMQSAPHAQALAGTTNVSAANAGIALGAMLGGAAIPWWGIGSVGWMGAAVGLLAAAVVPLVARLSRRKP